MKVAVCGVTGLVGTVMCKVLEERNFPIDEFIPVASERSIGKEIIFKGKTYKVVSMEDAINAKPDIALFSAGGSTSLEWAPKFAAIGTTVIDNSSAWRMHAYNIKRVIVSTYQSVTGTGVKAVEQMMNEREGIDGVMAYPHQIDMNIIPQIDVFTDNLYTKEEMKMVNETKKIMSDDNIRLTATAVRIPVVGGHSESINIEFEKEFELLSSSPGIILEDDVANQKYPMPKDAHNKDEVFVGRIRRDESQPNALNLWVVSDNLRKGAATNAVQIAEYLVAHNLVNKESLMTI